ncbi:MAG TPA: rhomboid family intramembrane serine protease, partial [Flavobacteriales bacterium]|nr:rhomboid family intramembrane serine protease [Flavobacteriales bacterium]
FRFPVLLVAIMWLVKVIEHLSELSFASYGLYPRELYGLQGIASTIFLHGDWKHLFNNSVPMLILGWALFYFYKEVAWKIIIWVVIMGGFWTWISARDAVHIGSSGLVYGLFSFLLLSGFIRKHTQLISISFLVAFLYGSLVWGLLPIDYKISWESHFWGFVAGSALAIYYRKIGKQKERHQWNEEEEAILENMDFWKKKDESNSGFNYIFKSKKNPGNQA